MAKGWLHKHPKALSNNHSTNQSGVTCVHHKLRGLNKSSQNKRMFAKSQSLDFVHSILGDQNAAIKIRTKIIATGK